MNNIHFMQIKQAIQKEERLRLKFFIDNEEALQASALKTHAHHVTDEELKESMDARKEVYHGSERYPIKTFEYEPKEDVSVYKIMRPVPEEVTDLIYKSSNVGRKAYLKKRAILLPENRYYFPETSSFRYGWKMWGCAKTMGGTKCGKSKIVKTSFYRRRAGIERDPDWYTTPTRLSPTICN